MFNFSVESHKMTEETISLVGADVILLMGDSYFEGIGTKADRNEVYLFYHIR